MAEREEISKLIADVTKMQSTDPAVKDIQNDIAALDKTVTALMNPAENGSGWKMLDQQDKESLVGQYEAILGKIGTYLKRPENEGPQDENREAIRQTMSKMQDYFTEDMATIRAYNPAAESKSLPTLFEDARVMTLETNGREMEKWGGALSSRMPMKINLNGKTVSGVFTRKKLYDPAGKLKSFFDAAMQKVPAKNRAQAQQIFDSVLNPTKKYKRTYPNLMDGEGKTPKGHTMNFLHNVIRYHQEGYTYVSKPHLLETLALQSGMTAKDVEKTLGKKAIKALESTLNDGEIIVNAEARMPEGADVGIRNVAMSRVADLFGIPEVIARSHPMKIKVGDEVFEGTFMEKAEGVDLAHPDRTAGYVSRDPMEDSDGEGLRQAADLQVLDYICGNIDRHRENMFYKFDRQGRFVGVMGIDNDGCMGEFYPMGGQNHLVGLNDLQFISEEMARKIMNTTEEQFRMSLHGMIEEKAVDAACFRLDQIKKKIVAAKPDIVDEIINDPDHKKTTGHLISLKKKAWGKDFVRKLIDGVTASNIFKKVIKSVSEIAQRKNPYIQKDMLKMKSVGNTNRATLGGVYAQYDKANQILSCLKSVTKGSRTSPEFEAIKTAADDYRKYTANLVMRMNTAAEQVKKGEKNPAVIQDQRVSQTDFRMMQEKLQSIKNAALHYKDNKIIKVGGEANASTYEKRRIQSSGLIADAVDQLLEMKPEEEKQMQINRRRTAEDMFRANRENEAQNPNPAPQP